MIARFGRVQRLLPWCVVGVSLRPWHRSVAVAMLAGVLGLSGLMASLAPGEELEFRGYAVWGDDVRFSVVHRQADGAATAAWVTLDQAIGSCTVRGFDPETEMLMVEEGSQVLLLRLRASRTERVAIAPIGMSRTTPAEIAEAVGRSRGARFASLAPTNELPAATASSP